MENSFFGEEVSGSYSSKKWWLEIWWENMKDWDPLLEIGLLADWMGDAGGRRREKIENNSRVFNLSKLALSVTEKWKKWSKVSMK